MAAEPGGDRRPFLARRLANDGALRQRVEVAHALGVPPSRLDGREPAEVTEHEYEGDRLVRSVTTREPLYTEQDRAELLALAHYRADLCPLCGGPQSECTAPEKRGPRYTANRIRCQRTDAVMLGQAAVRDGETPRPEALVWSTTETRR